MRVRLADVAAHAGVSEATVSRVLNGKPGVSDAQRTLILTALEVLGYERPPRARAKKAGLVGLIVPELDNPIFPMFAQYLETELAREGYTPVLCTQTAEGVHEDEYVRMLMERDVSGIVFVSGIHANLDTDPRRYAALREQGMPIVLINGFLPEIDAPFLSNDDATAIDLSVQHLAQTGSSPDRAGHGPAALRARAPQDLGLPCGDAHPRRPDGHPAGRRASSSSAPSSPSTAVPTRPSSCSTGGSRPSSAAPT